MIRRFVTAMCLAIFGTSLAAVDGVPSTYRAIAKRYHISPTVLYDTALRSSARQLDRQNVRPWPWTLLVAGEKRTYPNRQAAADELFRAMRRGQPVQIGLAGLRWSPQKGLARSPEALLDPETNLRLAAARLAPYLEAHRIAVSAASGSHRFVPVSIQANRYRPLIAQLAPQYGMDPRLIESMVTQESSFQPNAWSPAGAQGLMQLMPKTARRFGILNAWDPEANLHGGLRYLQWLHHYYQGDLVRMLAAYNAGEGAVDQYDGVPPYRETQHYVTQILARYGKAQPTFRLAEVRP